MVTEIFSFCENIDAPMTSEIFHNSAGRYSQGVLEITGPATSIEVEVQGSASFDKPNTWVKLAVVNESDLAVSSSITKSGIYDFSCVGKKIRIVVKKVSGGKATIIGKFSDGMIDIVARAMANNGGGNAGGGSSEGSSDDFFRNLVDNSYGSGE